MSGYVPPLNLKQYPTDYNTSFNLDTDITGKDEVNLPSPQHLRVVSLFSVIVKIPTNISSSSTSRK